METRPLWILSSLYFSFRGWRLCPEGLAFNPTSQQCEDEFSIPKGSYAKAFVKAYSSSNTFPSVDDSEPFGDPDTEPKILGSGGPKLVGSGGPKLGGSGLPDPRRRRMNVEREEAPNEINRVPPK